MVFHREMVKICDVNISDMASTGRTLEAARGRHGAAAGAGAGSYTHLRAPETLRYYV